MSESSLLSKEEKFHQMFVSSMERNCSGCSPSANHWELISMDLGRPIEELKAYGYRYMVKLFVHTNEQQHTGSASRNSFSSSCFEWKYDDQILFESLLVRFGPDDERWKKIASMMPNKSVDQIKQYYETHYRSSTMS